MGGAGLIPLPNFLTGGYKTMSESHIRIKYDYYRTPEYIDFKKQRKSLVYEFLLTAVIRGSNEVKNPIHPAYYIYKEHFLKGQLVGRYSQEKIAEYLKTKQPKVSTYLKELEQDGLIKKIVKPTKKGNSLYYQFGTWEGVYGEESYKEHIWFNEIFDKYYNAQQKVKQEKRGKEIKQVVIDYMFDGDEAEYERFNAESEREMGFYKQLEKA